MLPVDASKLRLIFMGTSTFSTPILEAFIEHHYQIVAAITRPDSIAGRHHQKTASPIKIMAQKYSVPILEWALLKNEGGIAEVRLLKPDLIVVAAYGLMIPKAILEIPSYGALNIHPSLLPKYRGASPIAATLLAGETKTGVSIILLDEQMDHGPIVVQESIPITLDDNSVILSEKLAHLGAQLLIQHLPQYLSQKLQPIEQDHSQATFCKILSKEDGKILFENITAQQLFNQIRAYLPWPGSWFLWNTTTIKILQAVPPPNNLPQPSHFVPGTLFFTQEKKLFVQCKDRALQIKALQVASGKQLSALDFIHGYGALMAKIV